MLDGNSSQCLPLVRSFYKEGHKITLVCPGIFSSGYFSRYVHQRLIWPRITGNEDEFYRIFFDHIHQKSYDLVLGLGDVSTSMLSSHKEEIGKYVKTVVPDYEVYSNAADKYRTMKLCMKHKIPCPLTIDDEFSEIDGFEDLIKFPVVVKPKKGVGAVGFTIINDLEGLSDKLPFLKKEFGELLIQEFIPNEMQYTVEVFCDHNSDLKACVISEKTRFFPVIGGTSCCNVTVQNTEIIEITKKLMKSIKWTGVANVDFILDPRDQTPKVIEINPRIGATVKIAYTAGFDFSKLFLQLADNQPIYEKNNYKEGIVMRNFMLDVLWFLFSSFELKKKTHPSFFQFFNRNTSYQSLRWDDPFPFIGSFLGNFLKYSNMKTIKTKLHLNSN